MKKLFLFFFIASMGFTVNAQKISLGANVGIPTGDISDASNFQAGADLAYRFTAIPLIDVGPMIGYSRFFVKDSNTPFGSFGVDDVQFMPIAASGRVNLPMLFVGLDLGYAIGLNSGNDGGMYYRPQIGVSLALLRLIASYQGISMDGGNVGSINLGVEIGI